MRIRRCAEIPRWNTKFPEPEEAGAFPEAGQSLGFAGRNRREVYGQTKAVPTEQEHVPPGIKTSIIPEMQN